MMNKEELKRRAFAAIDAHAQELMDFGQDIFCHPELGYKETRTAEKVLQAFAKLGISETTRPALTGVKGWLFQKGGPRVAVMGELDAVLSDQHPLADKCTGAAHACGHHAQLSALLGCAFGLRAVEDALCGDVCLMATPAEECVEIGWRSQLLAEGKIQYLGGKQQMIAEGAFDDVDMAMMVHAESDAPQPRTIVSSASSCFVSKEVRFLGREAHAGGAPWDGVNALNAATLAITAIHANRETFRDQDQVRVHPILTKGGDLVNVVPAEVHMESYVRAANIDAMQAANAKVNRAIRGAAYAVGAQVEICDRAGYLPMEQNKELSELFAANAALIPGLAVERGLPFCGSTDVGDVSYLLPVIQPTVSGFSGPLHSRDFSVADQALAYLVPAKLMCATVIDLLAEDGAQAHRVMEQSPRRTKEDYQKLWNDLLSS